MHSMSITNDYIVGLIDGEGSFTVYVRDPKSSKITKRRVQVEPKFYVKLTAEDKPILNGLKEFFGCGNVYFQKDTRKNHRNCYRYEVANRTHLTEIIIPFFKKNRPKIPTKKRDFELFCQMMSMIEKGKHLTSNGLNVLYQMKKRMH